MGLTVMPQVAGELGVRIDVPYRDLTAEEREIVLDGRGEKHQITVPSKNGKLFDLNFTYRSARQAVREAMNKATSERVSPGQHVSSTRSTCPDCQGTRLSERARSAQVSGHQPRRGDREDPK